MIRFHSLLGKKCLCPLFMASATPRERVNPWGQVLQASNSPPDASASIIQVQSSNVYDTLAYEVQGMLPAQYLLFPVGDVLYCDFAFSGRSGPVGAADAGLR